MGLRTLLGSADEALVHDPGPEGESGEGEAAMVMLCLTYFVTAGILFYGEKAIYTDHNSKIKNVSSRLSIFFFFPKRLKAR